MDLSRLGDLRPGSIPPRPPARTVRWRPAEWSAAPPRVAGFYHHRDPAAPARVRLATVVQNADGVLVARFANGEELPAESPSEWAGPLALTDEG